MRISSHLMGVGFLTNDIGAFLTRYWYMYREREKNPGPVRYGMADKD